MAGGQSGNRRPNPPPVAAAGLRRCEDLCSTEGAASGQRGEAAPFQNEIRYCVDFKKTANPVLVLERRRIPVPEDLFACMAGAKVFVNLDLSDAFTQLTLSRESQKLCVMNTHSGLYMFTRLIYGLASAPQIFQHCMDVILQGIPKCLTYIDNIVIFGESMRS